MTDATNRLSALPTASYKGIGLDINLQIPDETYPNFEKDRKEAHEWFTTIVLSVDSSHSID